MKQTLWAAVAAMASLASAAAASPGSAFPDGEKWLSLVDSGQYAQSWAAAGTLFKTQITASGWEAKVRPLRTNFGPVISRKPGGEKHATQLPGAPDGDYRILTFNTRFAHKQAAVETVVLAHEAAGWRVDGYFIK
jgi:hypothetical protein